MRLSPYLTFLALSAPVHVFGLSDRTFLSFNLDPEHRGVEGTHAFLHDTARARAQLDEGSPTFILRARPTTVHKPQSLSHIQRARSRSLRHSESEALEWTTSVVLGPDIEDRLTLVQLARMAGDAYAAPGQKNWYDVDPAWNKVRLVHAYCDKGPFTNLDYFPELSIWMGG